jgi:glycosyltransferase involved in cell wall biosynthesis
MQKVGDVQILVVDDGSGPTETLATRAFIEALRPTYPLLQPLLELPNNIGKGGAVYAGWNHASPDTQWLAFVDADGSISPQEVTRLISLARQPTSNSSSSSSSPISHLPSPISGAPAFDVHSSTFEVQRSSPALFASRVKMLGRVVNRQFKRHLLGRIYATLVSESLDIPIYDSQCGLKIIPAPAFRSIQNQLSILGFAFDVDLLVHLIDHGTPVIEVPIDWHEEPGGKVHLLRDSWRMAKDVLQIRRHRRHRRLL